MSLLIAPTLLDQFNWFKKCPESWKEKAYQDIKNTLERVPFEPNEAIQKGMQFEKLVYQNAHNEHLRKMLTSKGASDLFIKVCEKVKFYAFYRKGKKKIIIEGKEYLLYGRYDCYSQNKIIDIKTTANFKRNSYLEKWQHKFYCYIEGIKDFEYLVIEWKDAENDDYSIKEIHSVVYEANDFNLIEKEIVEAIKEFISFVEKDKILKDAYYNKYNLY